MATLDLQGDALREAVIRIFLMVSNIPYGGVGQRNTREAALKNRASCSSKHQLLAELLAVLNVEVRPMMGECNLNGFGAALNPPIDPGAQTGDYHNFLKIRLDGKWLLLDATFGVNEAGLDLPNNLNWDGHSDCRTLFPVTSSWQVEDIFEAKRDAVAKLDLDERARRDAFFAAFSDHLEQGRVA